MRAQVTARDAAGLTPLHLAASRYVARLLLAAMEGGPEAVSGQDDAAATCQACSEHIPVHTAAAGPSAASTAGGLRTSQRCAAGGKRPRQPREVLHLNATTSGLPLSSLQQSRTCRPSPLPVLPKNRDAAWPEAAVLWHAAMAAGQPAMQPQALIHEFAR